MISIGTTGNATRSHQATAIAASWPVTAMLRKTAS